MAKAAGSIRCEGVRVSITSKGWGRRGKATMRIERLKVKCSGDCEYLQKELGVTMF